MSSPDAPTRPSKFGRFFWRDPNTQFLILAAVAGLAGGLGAIVFRWLTRALTTLLMGTGDIVRGGESLEPWVRVLLPACGGLVGGLVARFFFGERSLHGISHMIEVVSLGRRTVRLRPALARGASSLAVISTGGSEGREGPIIQIGRGVRFGPGARLEGLARADPHPDGLRDGGGRRRRVQHADRRDALRARGRRRAPSP